MGKQKVSFKLQVRHNSMDDFKYAELPGKLIKADAESPSIADRELKRMVNADVFRSASETIKSTNSNPRRTK